MKKVIIYDNVIKDKNELLEQLRSLLHEADINMVMGEIFIKDAHALRIAIDVIKEME